MTDFTRTEWGPVQTVSGRLALNLNSGTAGAGFSGRATATIPLPTGGTYVLDQVLPSFAFGE